MPWFIKTCYAVLFNRKILIIVTQQNIENFMACCCLGGNKAEIKVQYWWSIYIFWNPIWFQSPDTIYWCDTFLMQYIFNLEHVRLFMATLIHLNNKASKQNNPTSCPYWVSEVYRTRTGPYTTWAKRGSYLKWLPNGTYPCFNKNSVSAINARYRKPSL